MYSGLVAFVCKDCLLFSPFFLINFIFPSKFLFFLTFICVCVHTCRCMYHSMHVEVRGQGASSFLSPCGFCMLTPGPKAWRQVPFFTC